MNNPTIYKIEYQSRSTVSIPSPTSDEVGSELFSESWTELDVAPNSGDLNDSMVSDSGNNAHVTTINFFIAGISSEQKMELNDLSSNPAVYRVTDGEGKQLIVGTDQFKARLSFGEVITATAEGKKGYQCQISCKSLYGPLIYVATDSGSVL